MRTKEKLWQFQHEGKVYCVQLHENFVITCSADKTTRIWNLDNGQEVHKLSHPGRSWNFDLSPNQTLLAVASDTAVVLWDFKNATKIKEFKLDKNIFDVRFSPDGTRLVAGLYEGEVFKIDLIFDSDNKSARTLSKLATSFRRTKLN